MMMLNVLTMTRMFFCVTGVVLMTTIAYHEPHDHENFFARSDAGLACLSK